jgi:uncharacterized RDD family membrane protein YckC
MKLLGKKIISYIIDIAIVAFFGSIFYFCANVFYLDVKTQNQATLMLVCALITVLLLTCYIPTQTNGQTVGQRIMKIRVVNKSGKPRTYLQSFLRECVIKISIGYIFVIFTAIYFIIFNVVMNHGIDSELPHDFLLKSEVVDVKEEVFI